MMRRTAAASATILSLFLWGWDASLVGVTGFVSTGPNRQAYHPRRTFRESRRLMRTTTTTARNAVSNDENDSCSISPAVATRTGNQTLRGACRFAAGLVLASTLALGSIISPAQADEYGVEVEAPTLFTGESVMICKKRGPLGACVETAMRTEENDNDKAKKYFREPTVVGKDPQLRKLKQETAADNDGNALITRLRQQSEDNREQNELLVRQKTFLNDQGASFGPFDKQVVILNTDGKTFTLLQNPQAMRLKKAGFIEDRKFVKQPTAEELEAAISSADDGGIGGAIQNFFGGS